MHVGAGSSNQGVIDNLVQRDPVDQLPVIFSSSLKGSLREFFEEVVEKDKPKGKKEISDMIFGARSSKDFSEEKKSPSKGSYIFHDGILLSFPVRSNKEPFFNATAPMVIERFIENAKLHIFPLQKELIELLEKWMKLNPSKGQPIVFNYPITDLKIEEYNSFISNDNTSDEFTTLKKLFGDRIVIFNNEDFITLTDDYNLPVIARNQLENGESKNLFYEQVVPRQTHFYAYTSNYFDNKELLVQHLNTKNIQVGANGSIGYGLCNFMLINDSVISKLSQS